MKEPSPCLQYGIGYSFGYNKSNETYGLEVLEVAPPISRDMAYLAIARVEDTLRAQPSQEAVDEELFPFNIRAYHFCDEGARVSTVFYVHDAPRFKDKFQAARAAQASRKAVLSVISPLDERLKKASFWEV